MFQGIKEAMAARKVARAAKLEFTPSFWVTLGELIVMLVLAAGDRHIDPEERTALTAKLQEVITALMAGQRPA